MRTLKFITVLVLGGFVFGQTSLHARQMAGWPYDKLWNDADIVVVIEPLKTENNDDQFQIPWLPEKKLQGLTTHFKVHGVFKGGPLPDEIVVKHFDYKPDPKISPTTTIVLSFSDCDGWFIRFTPGPLHYDDTISKDGKAVSHLSLENQTPMFLAFLKKTSTGAYVAVTGQIDPAFSFRDLREVNPSWENW